MNEPDHSKEGSIDDDDLKKHRRPSNNKIFPMNEDETLAARGEEGPDQGDPPTKGKPFEKAEIAGIDLNDT